MPIRKLKQRIRRQHPTPVDALTGYAHWAKSYPPAAHNPLMQIEEQAMLSLLPDSLAGKVCLDLACGSGRYILHLLARNAKSVLGVDYSAHMLAEAGYQLSIVNYQLSIINEHPPSRARTERSQSIPHPPSPIPNPKSFTPITNYQLPITDSQNSSHSSFIIHSFGKLRTGYSSFIRAPFFPLPFSNHTFDLITCGLAVGHERNLSQTLTEAARVLRPGGIMLYSDFHPFGSLIGWQRSFTADDGMVYNLEHYPHLYSEHQQACRAAGLKIETVLEPLLGDAAPEYQNFPAVLVIRAVKTGGE